MNAPETTQRTLPAISTTKNTVETKAVPQKHTRNRKSFLYLTALTFLALISILISIRHGVHPLTWADLGQFVDPKLFKETASVAPSVVQTLVWEIRLPRVLAALLIGGGLSIAGASYQGIFRNALVSPDILGASSGAALGSALGLLLNLSILWVQLLAFAFGMCAVLFTYVLGTMFCHGHSTLRLVLTGMVTGNLFVAGLSIIKAVADPYDTLPAITFWLMGSLSGVEWGDLKILFPPMAFGVIILLFLRWKLNVMSFSEEEAKTIGVSVVRVRILTLTSATLISSVTVAIGGLVGWVGLLVPHMARFIVGPNNKDLLPFSLLLGGIYLLWADNLARWLFRTELPLSVVTCICGAPVFLSLLSRARKGWA